MTAYLRPTGPIADDVLLSADPAVCMALAQLLVDRPLMANHAYGLWGYSGSRPGGRELTIQATGIGAASAATVLGELATHGARRAISVGVLEPAAGSPRGRRFVVSGAQALDGTSRALGSAELALPDPALTARLRKAAGPEAGEGHVRTTDPGYVGGPEANGVVATDLALAALFAAGAHAGVAVAAAFLSGAGEHADGELPEGLGALASACAEAFEA